jgi:hypothetical protein
MRPGAVGCIVVLAAGACSHSAGDQSFPIMPPVARATITTNFGRDTLPSLVDSASLAALTAFVNDRREGWGTPWAGVPVPRITVAFYRRRDDHGPIQHFGAGPGFFEASSQPGNFASRAASDSEVATFLRLIGAPGDAAAPRGR